jgi:hypothetical protein
MLVLVLFLILFVYLTALSWIFSLLVYFHADFPQHLFTKHFTKHFTKPLHNTTSEILQSPLFDITKYSDILLVSLQIHTLLNSLPRPEYHPHFDK